MSSNYWIIEPYDGIVVGDGKPFDTTPGARLKTRPFPPPSVTTGGIRTRHAFESGMTFTKEELETLYQIEVAGPLFVKLDEDTGHKCEEWYAPAPLDAKVYELEASLNTLPFTLRIHSKKPMAIPASIMTSMNSDLMSVSEPEHPNEAKKTSIHIPAWWNWKHVEDWLLEKPINDLAANQLGNHGPTPDMRTHVKIDPNTFGATEGFLFQTTQLNFQHTLDNQTGRYAMLVRTESEAVQETVAPLGGERRLMHWRKSTTPFPTAPQELIETIAKTKTCRIILLTPALWSQGYQPDLSTAPWSHHGVTPVLKAVANSEPLLLSGWDFQTNKPKPTRRFSPAGTVLFLELEADSTADVEAWAEAMWMQCVSDDLQAARDGFGLAVVGVWNQAKEAHNGA